MSLTVLRTRSEFNKLGQEWNQLLKKSASHVPFLRHEYLSSWWSTLGGGEWPSGELYVLLQRAPDETLMGIAPLFQHQNRLLLIGSYEISDYLDFIAPPEHLDAFSAAVVDHLAGAQNPDWEKLDLFNLQETSPTIPALKKAAGRHSWEVKEEKLQPAPCLELPESWEAYLDSLESRYRHEIERKLRRAESYFLPLDWYVVSRKADLEEEIQQFMELMAYNQEKAHFLTNSMVTQMKTTVQEAFQAGWIQLAFLTVGDVKAAGYLNFDFQNRVYVYNSGLNPMFENISPGWVLLSYLIRQAIEDGRDSFDFMRGDETYKYRFGGTNRYVHRLQITRG